MTTYPVTGAGCQRWRLLINYSITTIVLRLNEIRYCSILAKSSQEILAYYSLSKNETRKIQKSSNKKCHNWPRSTIIFTVIILIRLYFWMFQLFGEYIFTCLQLIWKPNLLDAYSKICKVPDYESRWVSTRSFSRTLITILSSDSQWHIPKAPKYQISSNSTDVLDFCLPYWIRYFEFR